MKHREEILKYIDRAVGALMVLAENDTNLQKIASDLVGARQMIVLAAAELQERADNSACEVTSWEDADEYGNPKKKDLTN